VCSLITSSRYDKNEGWDGLLIFEKREGFGTGGVIPQRKTNEISVTS